MIDTVPSDTGTVAATPMPSDTMRTADTATTKRTDTAKVNKK